MLVTAPINAPRITSINALAAGTKRSPRITIRDLLDIFSKSLLMSRGISEGGRVTEKQMIEVRRILETL